MQTWFILVRPLPVPTSSPQATHLRFSTIFVKNPFYNFWTPKESLSLVFKKLTIQETTSLLITIDFLRRTKRFLSFRVDNTIWSSWMNSIDLQVFAQELLREHLTMKFFKMVCRDVSFQKAFSEIFHW